MVIGVIPAWAAITRAASETAKPTLLDGQRSVAGDRLELTRARRPKIPKFALERNPLENRPRPHSIIDRSLGGTRLFVNVRLLLRNIRACAAYFPNANFVFSFCFPCSNCRQLLLQRSVCVCVCVWSQVFFVVRGDENCKWRRMMNYDLARKHGWFVVSDDLWSNRNFYRVEYI